MTKWFEYELLLGLGIAVTDDDLRDKYGLEDACGHSEGFGGLIA